MALSTDRPPDVTVEEDAPDSPSVESGELYDGTVRLRVVGDTGLLVEFAKNLRNRPGLRLLRLAKHGNGDMGLWGRSPRTDGLDGRAQDDRWC